MVDCFSLELKGMKLFHITIDYDFKYMDIVRSNPTFIEETYVVGTKLIEMELLMNMMGMYYLCDSIIDVK